jgi:hypothetical protein
MADQRRGGTIALLVGGEVQDAKGEFTYQLGTSKREAIIGQDRVHGYKENPQVPYIEGTITDRSNLDVKALLTGKDLNITLSLANGKTISLTEAWYAGDGKATTGEGEIEVRWEGISCEEVPA